MVRSDVVAVVADIGDEGDSVVHAKCLKIVEAYDLLTNYQNVIIYEFKHMSGFILQSILYFDSKIIIILSMNGNFYDEDEDFNEQVVDDDDNYLEMLKGLKEPEDKRPKKYDFEGSKRYSGTKRA